MYNNSNANECFNTGTGNDRHQELLYKDDEEDEIDSEMNKIEKKIEDEENKKLENDNDKMIQSHLNNTMQKTRTGIKKTELDKKLERNKKREVLVRPMPLVYSEENYKYNLFDEIGCLGDNQLAHKMKQTSNLNREAMDNFARTHTKYANINYFQQELIDAAASVWWDNPMLEKEF